MTEPREHQHQLLLKGPLVRKTLDGLKTNTRRLTDRLLGIGKITELQRSKAPGYDWTFRDRRMLWHDLTHEQLLARCPHGVPGDLLWVRETWQIYDRELLGEDYGIAYRADGADGPCRWTSGPYDPALPQRWPVDTSRWRPSIHMPRWASRLTLRVTDVRVERVQDISEEDARAEGVEWSDGSPFHGPEAGALEGCPTAFVVEARKEFRYLWNSLAPAGARWADNPYAWAVSFERVEADHG